MKSIMNNQNGGHCPLTNEEMNKLADFAMSSESPIEKALIFLPGRLAFRLGELIHLSKSWINFENKTITIPGHQPCGCCYCEKRKRELIRNGRSVEEAAGRCWSPKSPAGARTIYYGFDYDLIQELSDLYKANENFPIDEKQAEYRLRKIGNNLGINNLTVNRLRWTAIYKLIHDGLSIEHLIMMVGWDLADSRFQPAVESLKEELMRLYGTTSNTEQHDSKDDSDKTQGM